MNFTDAVNGSMEYNFANNFIDEAAKLCYVSGSEYVIGLLVVIAFCLVLLVIRSLSRDIMGGKKDGN